MLTDEQLRLIQSLMDQNMPMAQIAATLAGQYIELSGMDENNLRYRLRFCGYKIETTRRIVPIHAEPIAAQRG